ncbi:MAG TPA: SHOCT domain-containing protein [Streptosporangiaceae bacterium]|nr:SHOCT domain-containing protein [Streptosporangiaceae bacterium]
MFMRRRPLLRAAAVGGGAYMAGRSMGRAADQRATAEDEQDERIAALEQQQAPQQPAYQPPPPPSPAAPGAPSMIDQINQLSTLHAQGALTDEEFSAAKAKLLAT